MDTGPCHDVLRAAEIRGQPPPRQHAPFELRLEVDDVLASWAVTKGPSLDPAERRLGVQVGDHTLDHLELEDRSGSGNGRIQTKSVWETGVYVPAQPPGPALERGHPQLVLVGQKLAG